MTVGEFVNAVKEMREAQKKYFRTRSQDALLKSKELEKIVDNLIADREKRQQEKGPQQGSLFGEIS